MSANNNMPQSLTNATTIFNTKTKKPQKLFIKNTRQITGSVKKLVKENIKNVKLPSGVVYDKITKKIRPIFNKSNKKINRDIQGYINKNPNRLVFSENDILDLDTNNIYTKKSVYKGNVLKSKYKQYEVKNQMIYKKKNQVGDKLYTEPKKKNQRLTIFQIYNYNDENTPSTIEDFINNIKYDYNQDFSYTDKTRPIRRVLLRFGDNEFRYFPIDELDNLPQLIENYSGQIFGSDTNYTGMGDSINLADLDMSYYRIGLTGTTQIGADIKKISSKYWYVNQTNSKDNLCVEMCIKLGLKMTTRCYKMRDCISHIFPKIQKGSMIEFQQLPIYECLFKVNIKVYEDTQHYQNGNKEANLIRNSEYNFENTISVLYKEEHFSLIIKPKLKIKELNSSEKKDLGVYKNSKQNEIAKLSQAKQNKLKEIVVVFDNETIFDRFNENFLNVYGVSWVVWDMETTFDYNEGWNEDKTDNKYNHPPYCYYEAGEGCLRKLIKFLLNPPEGCIYKPIGFNNSRFDNFSLCETAREMGVLQNVFMADGSILYCSLEGVRNVWDASRFLTGLSLDKACKKYGTNPKKAKDLINHYEIQTYYERNGMEGLVKLLHSNTDYILYNKMDCLCLLDLVQKMRFASYKLCNEDILKHLTLSSMGYKVMDKLWDGKEAFLNNECKGMPILEVAELLRERKPDFKIYKPKTFQEDLFYRESLTAGRTQTFFGKLDYKGEVAMCDVKSLYPTIMGCYDNDCPMPYGTPQFTNEYQEGYLGIYSVDIIHQKTKWVNEKEVYKGFAHIKETLGLDLYKKYAPNVIPHRVKDCPLDWDYKKSIPNIKLTSIDIEVIKKATGDPNCIIIHSGYYWKDSRRDLFVRFLKPFKDEKTRQDRLKEEGSNEYNEALREFCKGMSNALSGKLLEAIHEDTNCIFSLKNWIKCEKDTTITELEILDFGKGFSMINGKKSKKDVYESTKETKRKPSYLGMFIYSYARKLMYQKLLQRYITLYMDTDSACMPMFEWDRCNRDYIDTNFINTGEYGCIEEEVCYTDKDTGIFYPATRIITISPKNYMVENTYNQEYSKRKMKGVRKNDLYLPLTEFGEYEVIDKKASGTAVDFVRQMGQDDIRRYRESGCCVNCINEVLDGKEKCSVCKSYQNKMKNCYDTEMFESMVKGEKIAVFCSMINRIKYRIKGDTKWEFGGALSNTPSIEQLEEIFTSNGGINRKPISMKVSCVSNEKYFEIFDKFIDKYPNLKIDSKGKIRSKSQLQELMVQSYNRFNSMGEEKNIVDIFKLKQQFLIKIL
tara:strand:+ start:1510 stop:5367 length:3858 start_codon:yes stop_codon:yes gene_type:complete